MFNRSTLRPLLALSAFVALASFSASAQTAPTPGLSVQGQGEVRVRPDIARLNLGVQTQNKDPQVATRDNAVRAQAVIAAVRASGVAERDIQTAGFSVSPQYDYNARPNDTTPQQPVLTGYIVSNEVRVVVRRVDDAGRVLDAALKAGANTASGITFDLDNRDAARDEALQRAVADAQRKANVLARAAGVGALRLVSLSEGEASAPPRPMFALARAAGADASTPVAPGEIVVSVSVAANYAFGERVDVGTRF